MTVPKGDHPIQWQRYNRRSAAASLQVEHRNLGGNKLSDQLEEETKYQWARRYSRSHCCWLGCPVSIPIADGSVFQVIKNVVLAVNHLINAVR